MTPRRSARARAEPTPGRSGRAASGAATSAAVLPDAARRALLAWYGRQRRALPWRRDRDAYRVWVSEVMLQQTTVRSAAPYYERFLERFPDVAALAAAPEEDVVGAWSGLGYYHRARNLHRGARHVAERHSGRFPENLTAALAVPGVGLYTASAVLSIAYGQPLAVVDGNVRRVLARLLALGEDELRSEGRLYNRAGELLDRDAPGEWNQALMELGATVCVPRRPACPACPVREACRARAEGRTESVPGPRPRRATVEVRLAAALVEEAGRVLLVRRGEGRLLGRMWELPQTALEPGLPDLARESRERHGLSLVVGALAVRARHAITHRRIRAEAYRARLRRRPPEDPERFRWVTRDELQELPVSSLTRKLLRGLDTAQPPLPLPED